jgi:hypothetical protein
MYRSRLLDLQALWPVLQSAGQDLNVVMPEYLYVERRRMRDHTTLMASCVCQLAAILNPEGPPHARAGNELAITFIVHQELILVGDAATTGKCAVSEGEYNNKARCEGYPSSSIFAANMLVVGNM